MDRRVWLLCVVVSGCLSSPSDPAPMAAAPEPLCPAPCERAVETTDIDNFEPSAAIHPGDPQHWLIASKDWVPENSAPILMRTHVSSDGGQTWTSRAFPGDVAPTHPLAGYTHYADPNVMMFEDGSAMLTAMATRGAIGPEGLPAMPDMDPNGLPIIMAFDLIAAFSPDGGRTWPEATVVNPGVGAAVGPVFRLNDQPFHVRGPSGVILMGWLVAHVDQPLILEEPDTRDYHVTAAVSYDNGRTWEKQQTLDTGQAWHRPRPAILDDGTMLMAYTPTVGGNQVVQIARSTDEGSTWEILDTPARSHRGAWLDTYGDTWYLVTAFEDERDHAWIWLHERAPDGTWSRTTVDVPEAAGIVTPALRVTANGTVVITHQHALRDGGNAFMVWARDATGDVRHERIDQAAIGNNVERGVLDWPILGDYHGLDVFGDELLVAWISGNQEDTDLHAAWLTA